ncbi:hypothetical protein BSIN_0303 [Burkholderia singularis]|uniref:Uncharacterized protein n=1 Tax=Burkholderia singularis TaxID=1503053 RepID=A0A238H4L0_9BURK|nr:hypothetical protein BSIN_0303 [Burkholderia singularis]
MPAVLPVSGRAAVGSSHRGSLPYRDATRKSDGVLPLPCAGWGSHVMRPVCNAAHRAMASDTVDERLQSGL